MSGEVWVLGATGRTGRAIAKQLHAAGVPLVLTGRDHQRLNNVAAELDGVPRVLSGSLETVLAQLAQDAPAVVVNTIGPFTTTAMKVIRACPPGTHYLDLSNELPATEQILALDRQAADAGQVFVTGAGFGVLGTESLVLRLCEGQPAPARVRVDALASFATEPGVLGEALASSLIEGLPFGGREVRQGNLVRSALASSPAHLTTPDGEKLGTAGVPSGELLAAWRASQSDSVVAASSAVPTNPLARLALSLGSVIIRIPGLSDFAVRRMARVTTRQQDRPRPSSWAHARVEWSSGTVREGWLRAGDGMEYTAAIAAEVARRLFNDQGQTGAHTPGALFGHELAEAVGGEFIIDADQGAAS